jgi:hypothetical protein
MRPTRPFPFVLVILASVSIAGCADSRSPVAPGGLTPRLVSTTSGATKSHVETPFTFDGFLPLPCLDEPLRAVVYGTIIDEWTTAPSGISSVRSYFDIDRSKTYTIYKGVTYYIAQGRPGHDDISHTLYGPNGLYVSVTIEPDFQSSLTGERLNLQLSLVTVIGPDGAVRVEKFTGQCPSQGTP